MSPVTRLERAFRSPSCVEIGSEEQDAGEAGFAALSDVPRFGVLSDQRHHISSGQYYVISGFDSVLVREGEIGREFTVIVEGNERFTTRPSYGDGHGDVGRRGTGGTTPSDGDGAASGGSTSAGSVEVRWLLLRRGAGGAAGAHWFSGVPSSWRMTEDRLFSPVAVSCGDDVVGDGGFRWRGRGSACRRRAAASAGAGVGFGMVSG